MFTRNQCEQQRFQRDKSKPRFEIPAARGNVTKAGGELREGSFEGGWLAAYARVFGECDGRRGHASHCE